MTKIGLLLAALSLSPALPARAGGDIKNDIGSSAAVVKAAPKKNKKAPAGKIKLHSLDEAPAEGESPKEDAPAKPDDENVHRFGRALKPARKSLLKPLPPPASDDAQ